MPKEPYTLTDPARLRALSHPLRVELLEVVGLERTATATRCAELTGESVASCAYHLGILAKYGFVEPAEGGRGREKPWRLVQYGQSWGVQDDMDPETAMAAETLSEVYVDRAAEKMKRWYRRSSQETAAWRDAAGFSGGATWMTNEELAELSQEFVGIARRFADRARDPAARPAGARPVEMFMGAWLPRPPDYATPGAAPEETGGSTS
ncbi:helix-turn-helix domain-containing protein [Pseudonocardia nematodicida]|uniref:Helix-turn-helix domain-containing protein n=1 Tax=Pseudonocardia nematodicida TaxID=1206997 RepID=A0ABV1K8K0_9PSEU